MRPAAARRPSPAATRALRGAASGIAEIERRYRLLRRPRRAGVDRLLPRAGRRRRPARARGDRARREHGRRLRHRTRAAARHAEARGLHRGRPRAGAAPHAETPRSSLFGGQALRRPYPGSTTVTTVNGGVTGLVHTLAVELAPIRVNAIHPGIVGDSPYWAGKPPEVLEAVRARTPIGRLSRWTRSWTRRSSCSRTAP